MKPPKGFVWASFVNGEEREDGPAVGATHAQHGAEREPVGSRPFTRADVFLIIFGFFIFFSLGSFSKNKFCLLKKSRRSVRFLGKLIEIWRLVCEKRENKLYISSAPNKVRFESILFLGEISYDKFVQK